MILAVMNAIFATAYVEAWKTQDLNEVWTRVLALLVRRSNQLSYEATDVWSFKGSRRASEEWMWSYILNILYIELR